MKNHLKPKIMPFSAMMSLLVFQVVDGENRTKLIVNYLPQTLTEGELHTIFSRCGEVIQHFFKLVLFLAGGCPLFVPGFREETGPLDRNRMTE